MRCTVLNKKENEILYKFKITLNGLIGFDRVQSNVKLYRTLWAERYTHITLMRIYYNITTYKTLKFYQNHS